MINIIKFNFNNLFTFLKDKNIIYCPYIINYLPFFENTNGATDYYYVHIRVGWMEWVVYKYSYDIILDQYVLAYLIFLYFQFLIILPIYYLYVVKNANYITSEYPDLDQIIFFQRFNLIIDIFLFIDFIILMSFYYYWPMSALSHALFYKVLTKSLFAWAIILFIFYYQLNLAILAIFFIGYSWRQIIVLLIQFSIFNSIIYLIWSYYHDSYSVKIGVLIAFHVIHAYSLNGWNQWYTDYDFEDIWRLGPEFEGWVFWHEYLEARQLRKAKIKKIYDYERQEYLKRRKKRLEEAQQKKDYKEKLRHQGKLNLFIRLFDSFFNIIKRVYIYFAYYDKELAIKAAQKKKKEYADSLQTLELQENIIDAYFTHLPEYYKQQYDEKQMLNLKKEYEEEWYAITRNEETLDMFYNLFSDVIDIKEEIIKRLKQSYGMHIFFYVLDKKPMTFLEFLKSYDDHYSLVDQRRRLVVHNEKDSDVRFEETLKSYEQLLKCDPDENVTYLRLTIRNYEIWERFGIRFEKDFKNQVKWNQYVYNLMWQAYEIMALNSKSLKFFESYSIIKAAQENLKTQYNLTEEEAKNQKTKNVQKESTFHLIKYEELDLDDFEKNKTNERDFFIENVNLNLKTKTLRQSIINYNKMDMFDNIQYEIQWDKDFLDFYTDEEKREQEEWEEGLKTNTYEKWKQIEQDDDYFKYTNFQKFLWWYDIELHVVGAYLFYWGLSYDKFWFALSIYGHSNVLTMV